MRDLYAVSILVLVTVLFSGLVPVTLARETTPGASPTRPGAETQLKSKALKLDPMIVLRRKIDELEKKVAQLQQLQQEVQFLRKHRHDYKKTTIGGCGAMNVANFMHHAQNNKNFRRDCGLVVSSMKVRPTPPPTYTGKPVK